MNQLQPIKLKGQRVLTTLQLAEAYGVERQIIVNNFNRHKDRQVEGKHYIPLTGEAKNVFLNQHQIDLGSKNAQIIYLWTEKGAWMHAKSLNTDQAWNAYEKLIDGYYSLQENVVPLNDKQSLIALMKLSTITAEETEELKLVTSVHSEKLQELETKVEEQITLDHGEQRRLQKGVARRVYEVTEDKKEAARLFRELYREIKDRFGVASYKDVKRKELQSAISYIENWVPRKVS